MTTRRDLRVETKEDEDIGIFAQHAAAAASPSNAANGRLRLRDVVGDRVALKALISYAEKEHNSENIHAWIGVQGYKRRVVETLGEAALPAASPEAQKRRAASLNVFEEEMLMQLFTSKKDSLSPLAHGDEEKRRDDDASPTKGLRSKSTSSRSMRRLSSMTRGLMSALSPRNSAAPGGASATGPKTPRKAGSWSLFRGNSVSEAAGSELQLKEEVDEFVLDDAVSDLSRSNSLEFFELRHAASKSPERGASSSEVAHATNTKPRRERWDTGDVWVLAKAFKLTPVQAETLRLAGQIYREFFESSDSPQWVCTSHEDAERIRVAMTERPQELELSLFDDVQLKVFKNVETDLLPRFKKAALAENTKMAPEVVSVVKDLVSGASNNDASRRTGYWKKKSVEAPGSPSSSVLQTPKRKHSIDV